MHFLDTSLWDSGTIILHRSTLPGCSENRRFCIHGHTPSCSAWRAPLVLPSVVLAASNPLGLFVGSLEVLAYCVRSTYPAFPWGEGRVPLMVQVLQGLFLLSARLTQEVKHVLR